MTTASEFSEMYRDFIKPTFVMVIHETRASYNNDEDRIKDQVYDAYVNFKRQLKSEMIDGENCNLDRRKLAACLCAAVLYVAPFILSMPR